MYFSQPVRSPMSAMFSVFSGGVSAKKSLITSIANQGRRFDTGYQKQCCCGEIHLRLGQQNLVNPYGRAIMVGNAEMDQWTLHWLNFPTFARYFLDAVHQTRSSSL